MQPTWEYSKFPSFFVQIDPFYTFADLKRPL